MIGRKTLYRGVIDQSIGDCSWLPVTVESVQESLSYCVKKRKNHKFVEESEEKHRMWECCRQPILSQTKSIFKNKHNSFNPKRYTYRHCSYREICLDFIVDQQITACQIADPSHFGIHYWKTNISVQI